MDPQLSTSLPRFDALMLRPQGSGQILPFCPQPALDQAFPFVTPAEAFPACVRTFLPVLASASAIVSLSSSVLDGSDLDDFDPRNVQLEPGLLSSSSRSLLRPKIFSISGFPFLSSLLVDLETHPFPFSSCDLAVAFAFGPEVEVSTFPWPSDLEDDLEVDISDTVKVRL